MSYTSLPVDSRSMHIQNDTFWATTLDVDVDVGMASVTQVGAGTSASCRIVINGPLDACR